MFAFNTRRRSEREPCVGTKLPPPAAYAPQPLMAELTSPRGEREREREQKVTADMLDKARSLTVRSSPACPQSALGACAVSRPTALLGAQHIQLSGESRYLAVARSADRSYGLRRRVGRAFVAVG